MTKQEAIKEINDFAEQLKKDLKKDAKKQG